MPLDEDDPAAAELTAAEGNLRTAKRAAAIKEELDHLLQARAQQQAIVKAETTQTAHMLAWRRRRKLESRYQKAQENERNELWALHSKGRLGSWMASGDKAVQVSRDVSHDDVTDETVHAHRITNGIVGWLAPARNGGGDGGGEGGGGGAGRGGMPASWGVEGREVIGAEDLPAGWNMGKVALSGDEWRARLGDAVVKANLLSVHHWPMISARVLGLDAVVKANLLSVQRARCYRCQVRREQSLEEEDNIQSLEEENRGGAFEHDKDMDDVDECLVDGIEGFRV
jgi:hypothetical protein